jgi:hypothetical protein
MKSTITFLPLGAELDGDERAELDRACESLNRLSTGKLLELHNNELFTPVARNVRTFWEAVLHRIIATAQGAIITWNAGNVLCSFLAARAFLETFALITEYHRVIKKGIEVVPFSGTEWRLG